MEARGAEEASANAGKPGGEAALSSPEDGGRKQEQPAADRGQSGAAPGKRRKS